MPNQHFIDKLINTFKRDIVEEHKQKSSAANTTSNEIAAKEKVVIAIHNLKDYYPAHARQRKNIYRFLNKELGLDIAIYDYDDTGENTLLSLDPNGTQQAEYNYIIEKFTAHLLEKENNNNQ